MSSPPSRSGILLVDKESGWTSHDVVAKVRRIMGTRRVGHAGTLDPMATGLLVLGVNSATRLLTYLTGCDKTYQATIRLGQSTSTDDAQGEPGLWAPVKRIDAVTDEDLAREIDALTGDIQQVPSSVSAIKVDGVRAYARARAGDQVTLRSRPVTVSRFDIHDVRRTRESDAQVAIDVDVTVDCSAGTYIRALARDLGSSLGLGGHLTALRRTHVGPYSLDEARGIDDPDLALSLIPLSTAASSLFPVLSLSDEDARALAQGKRPVTRSADTLGPLSAVSPTGTLVGLVKIDDGRIVSLTNFPLDAEEQ